MQNHAKFVKNKQRVLSIGGTNRGTDTISDVRHTDRERSTSNAQLATFNGVTERANAGPNMGTDTEFCRPAAQIEGQTRYSTSGIPSGTFNVQRSTRNVQWGDWMCAWCPWYGDRHDVWAGSTPVGWLRQADSGRRLRFHLCDKADIEVANFSEPEGRFMLRYEDSNTSAWGKVLRQDPLHHPAPHFKGW